MTAFRPYLVGPVLKGTAGRYSDIDLQLFTDDSKAVEFFLLARNLPYDISEQRYFAGDREESVSVLRLEWMDVTFSIAILAGNYERGTLKTSLSGRPIERASFEAVAQLLAADG